MNKKLYYSLAGSLIGACFLFFLAASWGHRSHRPDERAEDKGNGRRLWQEMFMRGRQTRDGRPAAAHRLEAKAQSLRLPLALPGSPFNSLFKPLSGAKTGPSCDWTEQGPIVEDDSVASASSYIFGNVSGRVTSLALDLVNDTTANTLYVGAAYGGLWKSTNALSGSPTYSFIGDPGNSLAVGAIALDNSVNPPIIYMGTGELNMAGDSYYGTGILKSPDGGSSWSLVSTANSGAISFLGLACSKILVDPTGPATVLATMGFACCHSGVTNLNQGIYRSTDSGATWNQVTTVNGGGQAIAGHSFTDVIYDGSATFYAAVRFQGIYYSTDHGASWTQGASPFPSATAPNTTNFGRATLASRGTTLWCLVADNNDGPSIPVTGTDTGLSQSVDGGNTWTAVKMPTVPGGNLFDAGGGPQGTYDQYVAAPSTTNSLLVAGIDIFRTGNVNGNGTSWTNLTNAYGGGTVHSDQHAVAFANAVTWFVGNDGGVWKTLNSGSAFSNLNTNLGTIQFYSASPDPSSAGKFIGGSQDNGTALNHSNSGSTWTEWYGGDGGFTDASPTVLGQFYAEEFFLTYGITRSDNYGADQFLNTVVDSSAITDASSVLVPYQVLSGSPVSIVLGTSRVWKGPGVPAGGVDGAGWVTISNNLDGAAGNILWLAAAPSNPAFLYATTTNNAATPAYHVFTNNGGSTWTNITGSLPTANPIQGLAVDPTNPQIAYVGMQGFTSPATVGHVFQTTNAGVSWTDISGNLPDAPVNSILVDPHFATDIYVANDVGVFATQAVTGTGTAWARMGTLLPDTTVLQIKISETCPRAILAATHGRGAWTICPLSVYCPPTDTPTPTATPRASNTPTPTATVTSTPSATPTGTWYTSTPTPVPGSSFSVQAWPNVVTNGQTTVRFQVTLPSPTSVTLSVYDVAEELLYTTTIHGNTGLNTMPWPVQSPSGDPLSNGIYIYAVQAGGNKLTGKIEVFH